LIFYKPSFRGGGWEITLTCGRFVVVNRYAESGKSVQPQRALLPLHDQKSQWVSRLGTG